MVIRVWFLGHDKKKGNDAYMKHCKILIEPIVESKDKNKGTKTDKKVVHVEREEEKDPEVEMMVRRRWTEENFCYLERTFQITELSDNRTETCSSGESHYNK